MERTAQMQLLQQQLQGGGALDPRILALCQQVSQLQVGSPVRLQTA